MNVVIVRRDEEYLIQRNDDHGVYKMLSFEEYGVTFPKYQKIEVTEIFKIMNMNILDNTNIMNLSDRFVRVNSTNKYIFVV